MATSDSGYFVFSQYDSIQPYSIQIQINLIQFFIVPFDKDNTYIITIYNRRIT